MVSDAVNAFLLCGFTCVCWMVTTTFCTAFDGGAVLVVMAELLALVTPLYMILIVNFAGRQPESEFVFKLLDDINMRVVEP